MAQAQLLPLDVELPLDLRLPRIGSVDAVALEARAGELAKRSIKKGAKLAALDLAIRMMDLTTLEGADTPGKVAALCAKAMHPDPGDPSIPSVAAVCVYPNLVAVAKKKLAGSTVKVASVATAFPSGPVADRGEARGRPRGRRARRRRDRHGDRPRRVPLGPLREGRGRDRARQGGVRQPPT